MARSLWRGSISFGLVNVPVRLFGAEREHEVHFHQINEKTGHRIKYEKVDAATGREVDADRIVRGIEVSKGKWVTIDDEEIEAIQPTSTRTVDVEDFVELAEIDPIFYDRTYYVAPDDNPGAARAYRLLLDAMQRSGRAGIGKVVIRNKQYLAALRPYGKVMVMSTMRFADEVIDPTTIDDMPGKLPTADAKARKMAESLVESLASPFEPERYHDTYTEELQDLIRRKAKGETIEVAPRPAPAAEVTDLMAALQASVDAAKERRKPAAKRAKPRKRAAA